MGYFSENQETKRVKLPSDKSGKYWVEVKTRLLYGDTKSGSVVTDKNTPDVVAAVDRVLEVGIVAWNLDDNEGNVLEVTPENINRLDQQDASFLVDQIGEKTDPEKKSD